MTCRTLRLPNGTAAIVCGPRERVRRCGCGRTATLLCDWKTGAGKTCDRPICESCAEKVGEDKHLCKEHQAAWRRWQEAHRQPELPEVAAPAATAASSLRAVKER